MNLTDKQMTEFEEATRPLIKWLNDNANPNGKIIITPDSAELLSGEMSFHTDDFITD